MYAEFDGYHVTLTAESGGQTNTIYLDWRTREALIAFIKEAEKPEEEPQEEVEYYGAGRDSYGSLD